MTKSKTPAPIKNRDELRKQVLKKEKSLRSCEDKILALSDVIKHKTTFLREKNAHEKAVRVAKSRMTTHMEYYNQDLKKRPPDRGDDIRMYTKMDLDVWAYPQVREWFNSAADPNANPVFDDSYRITPSQSGYMLKVGENYTERRHTQPPVSNLQSVSQSGVPSPRP